MEPLKGTTLPPLPLVLPERSDKGEATKKKPKRVKLSQLAKESQRQKAPKLKALGKKGRGLYGMNGKFNELKKLD